MSDDISVWLRSEVRSVDEIDKKIQGLENDIAFLRHKRAVQMRSGDIVDGLPQEILLMIFKHLPLRGKCSKAPSHAGLRESFFVCTHVCRRWRDLLVSTPSFWTTLYVSFKDDMAKLFLDRAGYLLPLSFINTSYGASLPFNPNNDSCIRTQSSRIRKLNIEIYSPPNFLSTINQSTFPILEHLTVANPNFSSVKMLEFSTGLEAASPIAPTLRYLEVRDIGVENIASPCFSNLSTLKLCDLGDKPALIDLIRGLKRMPRLENLVLDHAFEATVENMNQEILPSLVSLQLRDIVWNIEALLKQISSTQLQSIQIHSSRLNMQVKTLTSAAGAFYDLIPSPVRQDWCYQLTLAPGPKGRWHHCIHINPEPIVGLTTKYGKLRETPPYKFSVSGTISSLWNSFATHLPSPRIATLQFNRPPEVSIEYTFPLPHAHVKKLIVDSLSACRALLLGGRSFRGASTSNYPLLEEIVWVADRDVSIEDTWLAGRVLQEREAKGLVVKKFTIMCDTSAVREIQSWRNIHGEVLKATEINVVVVDPVSSLGIWVWVD